LGFWGFGVLGAIRNDFCACSSFSYVLLVPALPNAGVQGPGADPVPAIGRGPLTAHSPSDSHVGARSSRSPEAPGPASPRCTSGPPQIPPGPPQPRPRPRTSSNGFCSSSFSYVLLPKTPKPQLF